MMNKSPSKNAGNSICQAVIELIPAYAIGATDPEETRFVERYLNDCPEAAAELQLYSQLHDDLLFETPLTTAPPRLAAKIAAIPKTSPRTTVIPLKQVEKLRTRQPNFLLPVLATAAAALIIIMLMNVYWIGQVNDLQNQQQTLQTAINNQFAALNVASAQDATITRLISSEAGSDSVKGSVIWSPVESTALLQVGQLPDTGNDHEYQLWLMTDNDQLSAGTFRVNTGGTGILVFNAPAPIQQYTRFGITLEPAGGSVKPTTAPILTGEI